MLGLSATHETLCIGCQARHCGKTLLLEQLLVRLKSQGDRVLLFTQMVGMLTLFEELMASHQWRYQRLDGSTPPQKRQVAIDHFNAPHSTDFCFLLSTRAGGLGYVCSVWVTTAFVGPGHHIFHCVQHQPRDSKHCHHLRQ